MLNLKGHLTISRVRGGDDQSVMVRLVDAESRETCVDVRVDLTQFAEVLMGLGRVPCEFEFNDSGAVGCREESEERAVFVPSSVDRTGDDWKAKAVARDERGGWRARLDDIGNGHRLDGCSHAGSTYRVLFTRHVKPNGEPLK